MQKYEKIHERALEIASRYRKAEAEMLVALQEVDGEQVYLHLGYSSLFKYAELALTLSPVHAYDFITVARKAGNLPALMHAVRDHRITVAKARRICPVINHENQVHWIAQAATLSHRELEKVVATANPDARKPDRSKYVAGDRIELRFDVSEEIAGRFEKARDLVSQKLQLAASFEDTLREALNDFLGEEVDFNAADLGTVPSSKLRKFILSRDQHRCTFTAPDGRRCETTRWLDIHHILPRSEGGSDDPENLTTLCSAHHRLLHQDSTL